MPARDRSSPRRVAARAARARRRRRQAQPNPSAGIVAGHGARSDRRRDRRRHGDRGAAAARDAADGRRQRSRRGALRQPRCPASTSLHVESTGFETIDVPDLNVRRGRQEKREVRLEIGKYVEEVEVTRDKTDEVLNDNFSSALTQEQIDALPDDEEEMAEQLRADGRPRRGAARQRLLGRSSAAEVADRRDPLPLRSLFGGEPRVGLPARRHPHPARATATGATRRASPSATSR